MIKLIMIVSFAVKKKYEHSFLILIMLISFCIQVVMYTVFFRLCLTHRLKCAQLYSKVVFFFFTLRLVEVERDIHNFLHISLAY